MLRKSDHDFQGLGRVIAVRGESKIFHRFSHAAHLRGGDLVPNGPARDLALGLSEGLQKPGASPSSASQASSIELCTRSQLTGEPVVNAVTRPGRSAGVGNSRSGSSTAKKLDDPRVNLRSAIERVTIGRTTILTTPTALSTQISQPDGAANPDSARDLMASGVA